MVALGIKNIPKLNNVYVECFVTQKIKIANFKIYNIVNGNN